MIRKPLRMASKLTFLGGGPSATAPLVYCLKNNIEAVFLGEIADSLLFSGRDPQKTYRGLLEVAHEYKSFSSLLDKTILYYEYLQHTSEEFGLSLEDTIEAVYHANYKAFGDKCMLNKIDTSEFTPVSVINLNAKKNTYVMEGINMSRSKNSSSSYLYNGVEYQNLAEIQKGLHYLPVFFPNWKPISAIETKSAVINRAGFRYPGKGVHKLMSSLNFDLVRLCLECLESTKQLNELELAFKNSLNRYVKIYSRNFLDDFEEALVVGGGRASGEIARRLAHDVDWKQTASFYSEYFETRLPSNVISQLVTKYRDSVNSRRKKVIVVDHRLLTDEDISEASTKFHKAISCSSYSDFFLEICKHNVCPRLTLEQVEYYQLLLDRILSLNDKTHEVMATRIENLIAFQEKDSALETYTLFLSTSRDTKLVSKQFPKHHLFSIGGAEQEVLLNSQLSVPDYQLKRIKDSHFRQRNLEFVTAVAKNKLLELEPRL